jgi:hypothetical protein
VNIEDSVENEFVRGILMTLEGKCGIFDIALVVW